MDINVQDLVVICTVIPSIVITAINVVSNVILRVIEHKHDERVHKQDLEHQMAIRQFEIYYEDKKNAFSDFVSEAGKFAFDFQSASKYISLHSSIDRAILFCSKENQSSLRWFQEYIDQIFGKSFSPKERLEYSNSLILTAISLNEELESTKPGVKM